MGCPGCIAIQTGLPVRSHSAECRTADQQRLMQSEEGKLRVERAEKRKKDAAVSESAEGQAVLEDVPDASEEMHGPGAIGAPPPERVGPLDRPVQASKRLAEEGKPDEAEKKARTEPAHGVKRDGADLEKYEQDERTMMDLYKDIVAGENFEEPREQRRRFKQLICKEVR